MTMTLARRSLALAALAISVASCADQSTAVQPTVPEFLEWADTTVQFSSNVSYPTPSDSGTDSGTGTVYFGPRVNLERTHVTFWAVRGEPRSVQIDYKSRRNAEPRPFL